MGEPGPCARAGGTVTAQDRYATPNAFRRALTDRLKLLAESSHWTVPQLQRQVAYDRLLERLYQFDRGWVVKGATALMARELGARATLDIPLPRDPPRDRRGRPAPRRRR